MLIFKGSIQCDGCGDSHAVKKALTESAWTERVQDFAARHGECERQGHLTERKDGDAR